MSTACYWPFGVLKYFFIFFTSIISFLIFFLPIFLEFFSEDFEWLDDNTHYIMRLKGNILSAPGNTFIEAGFSKYEVVEKLTEILQKYTNNPKIVELFQTINTDFQE